MQFPRMAILFFFSLTLLACGDNSEKQTFSSVRGQVVNRIIENAKVCLDCNASHACEGEEAQSYSDNEGSFIFERVPTVQLKCPIVAEINNESIDVTSQEPITSEYSLIAPAGSQFVSPITTLVHHSMKFNRTHDQATEHIMSATLSGTVHPQNNYQVMMESAELPIREQNDAAYMMAFSDVVRDYLQQSRVETSDFEQFSLMSHEDMMRWTIYHLIQQLNSAHQIVAVNQAANIVTSDSESIGNDFRATNVSAQAEPQSVIQPPFDVYSLLNILREHSDNMYEQNAILKAVEHWNVGADVYSQYNTTDATMGAFSFFDFPDDIYLMTQVFGNGASINKFTWQNGNLTALEGTFFHGTPYEGAEFFINNELQNVDDTPRITEGFALVDNEKPAVMTNAGFNSFDIRGITYAVTSRTARSLLGLQPSTQRWASIVNSTSRFSSYGQFVSSVNITSNQEMYIIGDQRDCNSISLHKCRIYNLPSQFSSLDDLIVPAGQETEGIYLSEDTHDDNEGRHYAYRYFLVLEGQDQGDVSILRQTTLTVGDFNSYARDVIGRGSYRKSSQSGQDFIIVELDGQLQKIPSLNSPSTPKNLFITKLARSDENEFIFGEYLPTNEILIEGLLLIDKQAKDVILGSANFN